MEKEKSLSQELVEIDTSLAKLIFERARLLGKAASARKNKKIALADPKQEKRLWAVWKKELHDRLDHPGLVRELFFNLNALSYIQSEEKEAEAYRLAPSSRPLQAELPGPRDSFYFRAQLFLAALSDGATRLPHNPQAASVQELITALNSWKGSIARQGTNLVVEGTVLQPSEDTAFVGGEPFTFYLLLCLALSRPCQIRFVGSAHLRRLKIQNLCAFLPQLGARLTPVEPAGFSLPARLESSGMLPSELVLSEELPVEFLAALLLSAPCFPRGLRLTFPAKARGHRKILVTFELLAKFGLAPQEEMRGEQCAVFLAPAHPQPPEPELDSPLEASFAAVLLLMPLVCGGVFCLRGRWPEDEQAQNMLVFLEQTGVQISRTSSTLVASRQSGGQTAIHLELEADMDFFHLALAAALLSQKEYRIACDEKSLSYSYGIEFLDFLGAKYSHEAGRLLLPPQKIELPAEAWTSPAPEWTLAFALLAFSCPGLRLNNPGQLLAYWPGFWNIFNSLPRPVLEKWKKKEMDTEHVRKGKRIRLD